MIINQQSARQRHLTRSAIIFAQGEPATHVLLVEEGIVRMCLYLADGQRVISGFAFPGEVLGLDDRIHRTTAEAVCAVTLRQWELLPGACESEIAILLTRALRRTTLDLGVRGRRLAFARVAAFIVDLHDRNMGVMPKSSISLSDVADYLGLTSFTVSRVLALLRRQRIIQSGSRGTYSIADIDRLRAIADNVADHLRLERSIDLAPAPRAQ